MIVSIMQFIISLVLYFVLFFGIGFILNMLFRTTWLMAIIYPVIILFFVNDIRVANYWQEPGESFLHLWERITGLYLTDVIILSSGFIGSVLSGLALKALRKKGYQMF